MIREDEQRLDCPDCEALPEKIAGSGFPSGLPRGTA